MSVPVTVAIDTCILLDLASKNEQTIDAVSLVREKLRIQTLYVPPTVLQELNFIREKAKGDKGRLALTALQNLLDWGFEPFNLISAGHGIVEQIGLALRQKGLIPDEEQNDSLIIAEVALAGFGILLTRDAHMLEARDSGILPSVLSDYDVSEKLIIQSPSELLAKFAGRKR
jgi:predicted nucleic acid-binding protein